MSKFVVDVNGIAENLMRKSASIKDNIQTDAHAARELELFTENEQSFYNQMYLPIIKNLTKKKNKGVYDSELAVKAFMHLVDEAAKKYVREFGATGERVRDVFNRATREQVAREFRDKFESEYENQSYDFMERNEVVAGEEDRIREPEEFEEDEFSEPQDGDYTMTPSGSLGSRTSVGIVNGKFLGEFDSGEAAAKFINKHMQKENFFPNVWYIDDHGGSNLINVDNYL